MTLNGRSMAEASNILADHGDRHGVFWPSCMEANHSNQAARKIGHISVPWAHLLLFCLKVVNVCNHNDMPMAQLPNHQFYFKWAHGSFGMHTSPGIFRCVPCNSVDHIVVNTSAICCLVRCQQWSPHAATIACHHTLCHAQTEHIPVFYYSRPANILHAALTWCSVTTPLTDIYGCITCTLEIGSRVFVVARGAL